MSERPSKPNREISVLPRHIIQLVTVSGETTLIFLPKEELNPSYLARKYVPVRTLFGYFKVKMACDGQDYLLFSNISGTKYRFWADGVPIFDNLSTVAKLVVNVFDSSWIRYLRLYLGDLWYFIFYFLFAFGVSFITGPLFGYVILDPNKFDPERVPVLVAIMVFSAALITGVRCLTKETRNAMRSEVASVDLQTTDQ